MSLTRNSKFEQKIKSDILQEKLMNIFVPIVAVFL